MTITRHDRDTSPAIAQPAIAQPAIAPPSRHGLLTANARPVPAPRGGPPRSWPGTAPPHQRRQPWPTHPPRAARPESRAKEAFGIAGVMAIVVTAGVSLGFAWTSDDPLSVVDVAAAQGPDSVGGLPGLAPGGPAGVVQLPVTNAGVTALTVTGVAPQLFLLPSTCPSTAWRFTVPAPLPVVAAGSDAQVPVQVALAGDAPAGCQAVNTSLHAVVSATAGGLETSIDTTAPLSTGRLGSPGAGLSVEAGAVRVLVSAPSQGPQPSGYTVDAVGPDGRHVTVCALPTLDPCVDTAAPSAVRRSYVVTAHAGSQWRRDSTQVEVWTPPPAPTLTLGSGSAASARDLVVTAPAAGGTYQVTITVDGVQVAGLPVPGGVALDRSVRLTRLAPGPHQAVARAGTHDASILVSIRF